MHNFKSTKLISSNNIVSYDKIKATVNDAALKNRFLNSHLVFKTEDKKSNFQQAIIKAAENCNVIGDDTPTFNNSALLCSTLDRAILTGLIFANTIIKRDTYSAYKKYLIEQLIIQNYGRCCIHTTFREHFFSRL